MHRMTHRLLVLGLALAAILVQAAAPPGTEDAAWEAVYIDRSFPDYPPNAAGAELAAAKLQRGAAYQKIADEFKAFRAKYPQSRRDWMALTMQLDALHKAYLLGQAAVQAQADRLTTDLLNHTHAPKKWKLSAEVKKVDRQVWQTVKGDEKAYPAARIKGYSQLLASQKVEEDQTAMGKYILDDIEAQPEEKQREAWAKQVLGATKNEDVIRKSEQLLARSPYIGKPLDLKFTAVDGRAVDLAKLRGKVVMIVFWATWCPECVKELPELKEEYADHQKQGMEIIGISLDSDKKTLTDFLKKEAVPWPQFFDGMEWDNQYAKQFGIGSTPTTFLINKQGILVNTGVQDNTLHELLEAPGK
jgi:peroxiredoxin